MIWPTPVLLRLQVGAVMYDVPDAFAVHALHVAAFVPRPQPAFDQLSAERTGKVVGIHGVYYLPDVVQPKVPTLLARISCPLLFDRKSLEDNVLVQLAVNRLPHVLEEVAGFVQNEKYIIGILAWLHLRFDELLMEHPSGLLSVTVVLFSQSPPRRLSVPRSIFWPLALELLNGVVCGAGCGEE